MDKSPSLYVFDLDKTLICKNSSLGFYIYLIKKNVFSKSLIPKAIFYFFLKKFELISLEEFHERAFQTFLLSKPKQLIEELAEEFVQEKFLSYVCKKMLLQLQKAKHQSAHILLLSSSPDFLVRRFAKFFGIQEWRGSSYYFDAKGAFSSIQETLTGEKKRSWLFQRQKSFQVEKGAIYAFSDSEEDLPLLKEAKNIYLIRPTKKLQKLGKKEGWQFL